MPLRTAAFCALALACFAANSLLCRSALRPGLIDPASFWAVRVASGLAVLLLLARGRVAGSWRGALWLSFYGATFSFAYLRISAGMGALLLFGVTQLTMIAAGVARGERPHATEWLGLALAFFGLVALTLPGLGAPDPLGVALMAAAGVGWGSYSLVGRRVGTDPVAANAGNFVRALPLCAALWISARGAAHISAPGLTLAAVSGGVTSGIGYAFWYAALRELSRTRAAILQLSVPVLAAVGGLLLLGEPLTPRLLLWGAVVLGGVLVAQVAYSVRARRA